MFIQEIKQFLALEFCKSPTAQKPQLLFISGSPRRTEKWLTLFCSAIPTLSCTVCLKQSSCFQPKSREEQRQNPLFFLPFGPLQEVVARCCLLLVLFAKEKRACLSFPREAFQSDHSIAELSQDWAGFLQSPIPGYSQAGTQWERKDFFLGGGIRCKRPNGKRDIPLCTVPCFKITVSSQEPHGQPSKEHLAMKEGARDKCRWSNEFTFYIYTIGYIPHTLTHLSISSMQTSKRNYLWSWSSSLLPPSCPALHQKVPGQVSAI